MIIRKALKLSMTEYVGQETEYLRVDELNISLWRFVGLFGRDEAHNTFGDASVPHLLRLVLELEHTCWNL